MWLRYWCATPQLRRSSTTKDGAIPTMAWQPKQDQERRASLLDKEAHACVPAWGLPMAIQALAPGKCSRLALIRATQSLYMDALRMLAKAVLKERLCKSQPCCSKAEPRTMGPTVGMGR